MANGLAGRSDWCENCCNKRGKCQFKEKWAPGPGAAAEPPVAQQTPARALSKRSASAMKRDLRKGSSSRKFLAGEIKRLRRDQKRAKHGEDRLAPHLSKLTKGALVSCLHARAGTLAA